VAFYRRQFSDLQIFLWDNCSTDGSPDLAASLGCHVMSWTGKYGPGEIDDYAYRDLKNHGWKKWVRAALQANAPFQWLIVGDMDEWLVVTDEDLRQELQRDTTILRTAMYNMSAPQGQREDLSDVDLFGLSRGAPNEPKNMVFRPDQIVDMRYNCGAHKIRPIGRVQFSQRLYTIKHMHPLSYPYFRRKNVRRAERAQQMQQQGLANHYTVDEGRIREMYESLVQRATEIPPPHDWMTAAEATVVVPAALEDSVLTDLPTADQLLLVLRGLGGTTPHTPLHHLMCRHGSPKSDALLSLYSACFSGVRHHPFRLFELGVGSQNPSWPSTLDERYRTGGSLFAWGEYFDHAQTRIMGADIDRHALVYDPPRIMSYCVDQTDKAAVKSLCDDWEEAKVTDSGLDLLVDDGLQEGYRARDAFLRKSVRKVRKGGMYVAENVDADAERVFRGQLPQLQKDFGFQVAELVHLSGQSSGCVLVILV
jgi:hypothetical protein